MLFHCLPFSFKGFGLPILESLIRIKPCICGSNGALGEVAKSGGCLKIENQKNINQIQDAIKLLLTDSSLLKKLSLEARVRKYDTWENYSKKLISYFSTST